MKEEGKKKERKTFIKAFAGCCAGSLNIPIPLLECMQAKLVRHLEKEKEKNYTAKNFTPREKKRLLTESDEAKEEEHRRERETNNLIGDKRGAQREVDAFSAKCHLKGSLCTSAVFIAFGKSCLFAKTKRAESLNSSSWRT